MRNKTFIALFTALLAVLLVVSGCSNFAGPDFGSGYAPGTGKLVLSVKGARSIVPVGLDYKFAIYNSDDALAYCIAKEGLEDGEPEPELPEPVEEGFLADVQVLELPAGKYIARVEALSKGKLVAEGMKGNYVPAKGEEGDDDYVAAHMEDEIVIIAGGKVEANITLTAVDGLDGKGTFNYDFSAYKGKAITITIYAQDDLDNAITEGTITIAVDAEKFIGSKDLAAGSYVVKFDVAGEIVWEAALFILDGQTSEYTAGLVEDDEVIGELGDIVTKDIAAGNVADIPLAYFELLVKGVDEENIAEVKEAIEDLLGQIADEDGEIDADDVNLKELVDAALVKLGAGGAWQNQKEAEDYIEKVLVQNGSTVTVEWDVADTGTNGTATVGAYEIEFEIIFANVVSIKAVKTGAFRAKYVVGDTFDPEGLEIELTFDVNGADDEPLTKLVAFNEEMFELSDDTLGTVAEAHTITVTLKGSAPAITTTFTVEVEAVKLLSIRIGTPTAKTTLYAGEAVTLNAAYFDDLEIYAIYNNTPAAGAGSEGTEVTGWIVDSVVDEEGEDFDNADPVEGTYIVTISYTEGVGDDAITVETTFEITVIEKPVVEAVLESIAITTPTAKTTYYEGIAAILNAAHFSDLVVTATYDDTTTKVVTGWTVSNTGGFDVDIPDEYTITVSYTEGEVTDTATFTVTVYELLSIAVDVTEVEYTETEIGDFEDADALIADLLTKIVVTATYDDGDEGITRVMEATEFDLTSTDDFEAILEGVEDDTDTVTVTSKVNNTIDTTFDIIIVADE